MLSEFLINFLRSFWSTLGEMAPFLLFGFFVAGVLAVFFRSELIEKHLGGHGTGAVIKAAVLGVPLPLCSCGVIPVAASLRKHGAGPGATTSFLISTPQTGVDSIMVTLSLLGPVFAIFRPLVAFVSGIIGGIVVNLFGDKPPDSVESIDTFCKGDCLVENDEDDDLHLHEDMGSQADAGKTGTSHSDSFSDSAKRVVNRFRYAMKYGFVTLPRDINTTLLIGLAIAAAISALVPDDFFAETLGAGFLSLIVMMVVGIPIYVCATASVPIAAALMMKGISPGAALVFLMTGPATNAATISTIWKIMGRRSAALYLLTVGVTALAAGTLLNMIFAGQVVSGLSDRMWMIPTWVRNISALVLIAVLVKTFFKSTSVGEIKEVEGVERLKIVIDGMTCEHCAMSVRRAIMETKGVESAVVDLKESHAIVSGGDFDIEEMTNSIEELGYRVTGVERI